MITLTCLCTLLYALPEKCVLGQKKKKTVMMCIIVAKARSICKFVLESEINNYTRKSPIKLTPGES